MSLAKPFHLSELSMRIYALIRRRKFAGSNLLRSNGIEIDLPARAVSVEGRAVVLTRTEYELLLFFIGNAGKVVSKASIAEHLSALIPFCTHGGSRFSQAEKTIASLEPGAKMQKGLAISRNKVGEAETALQDWLQRLGFGE